MARRRREIGGQWEITFRHSTALAEIRQQVQDLAHRLDHLDTIGGADAHVGLSTASPGR